MIINHHMSKGIIVTSFGENCDRMASHSVAYSRRFTSLPFFVITNIENRDPKWKSIKDVAFHYVDCDTKDNREYKTSMIDYTPYDLNIYMDADSVIQNEGIENLFDLIPDEGLLLNRYLRWNKGDKVVKIYKNAMDKIECKLPLDVFNGAFMGFRKDESTIKFFDLWQRAWKTTGSGREMPALNCVIKKHDIPVEVLPKGLFVSESFSETAIVQHDYPTKDKTFYERFEIPYAALDKSFDVNKDDWTWVDA
jgi:hypothetical protein